MTVYIVLTKDTLGLHFDQQTRGGYHTCLITFWERVWLIEMATKNTSIRGTKQVLTS